MNLEFKRRKNFTFYLIFGLYFMIYFCLGIIPANIDNLLLNLKGTTEFEISLAITLNLLLGMVSMLFFGYYGEKLTQYSTRQELFFLTNSLWIISYGLIGLSPNYLIFLFFICLGAIGIGGFLPLGFSMIGDLYPVTERGTKFGLMQFALALGNGVGIVIGDLIGWQLGFMLGFEIGLVLIATYFIIGVYPTQEILQDSQNEPSYDYKITANKLMRLIKVKSILGILLAVLCSGLAISTLANWGVFFLQMKLPNDSMAIMVYIFAGLGALPGAILGGKLGDKFLESLHHRGRVVISFIGLFSGVLFLLWFYSYPFILTGMLGYFFFSFAVGNQFAIYSEVCVPELKGMANAMNGLMLNLGGVLGNVLISVAIVNSINILYVIIPVVLFIWLIGTFFWILPYRYYPIESGAYLTVKKNFPIKNLLPIWHLIKRGTLKEKEK